MVKLGMSSGTTTFVTSLLYQTKFLVLYKRRSWTLIVLSFALAAFHLWFLRLTQREQLEEKYSSLVKHVFDDGQWSVDGEIRS